MTKKEHILKLHTRGLTTREIATKVFRIDPAGSYAECDRKMAYVRVVIRQRKSNGRSAADLRWARNGGQALQNASRVRRYASDPAYRQKCIDSARDWQKKNQARVALCRKRYRAKNRTKINAHLRLRYQTDPAYRAKEATRKASWWQRKQSNRDSAGVRP